MTVIYTRHGALKPGNKLDWFQTSAAGYFRMPKEGGKHDCHYAESTIAIIMITMNCILSVAEKRKY